MNDFYNDVKDGLSSEPKRLYSKYFYDKTGDLIFQKLMHSSDYYLSRCELEILQYQSDKIINHFIKNFSDFDLIELGAGDASKSIFLLKALLQKKNIDFTYYPIDISSNVVDTLERTLPKEHASLKIKGLNGEYLPMLKQQTQYSKKPKVILFLGSNIGNMHSEDALEFCGEIQTLLNPGDLLFIGFDLKKDPTTILAAYNDKDGLTKEFNLNLLRRINRELDGDFDIDSYSHYPCYDPETGECKSYLISKRNQDVVFGKGKNTVSIHLKENETIFMEISKKYNLLEIENLAQSSAFKLTNHFLDSKKWFVDSLWERL